MKKIVSLGLAGLMLVSACPMVYAADVDYSQGTAVEYVADSDANREYTITVPAKLAPGASGTVTLSGKWASNETVKVTADANVVLTNSINDADTKTLDVTFLGIEKAGNNNEAKTYTEAVSVAGIDNALFGTWSGKFNYNVEFVAPVEMITLTIDGVTIQAEEGMTWSEWLGSEYNTEGYVYVPTNIQNADGLSLFVDDGLNKRAVEVTIEMSKYVGKTLVWLDI